MSITADLRKVIELRGNQTPLATMIPVCQLAADEIDRLTAENKALKEEVEESQETSCTLRDWNNEAVEQRDRLAAALREIARECAQEGCDGEPWDTFNRIASAALAGTAEPESAAVVKSAGQCATCEAARRVAAISVAAAGEHAETVVKLTALLQRLLRVPGDHMTACDKTMGDSHLCTCGADEARRSVTNSATQKDVSP